MAASAGAAAALLFPNVGTICRLPSMNTLISSSVTFAFRYTTYRERSSGNSVAMATTYVLETLHEVLKYLDALPFELARKQPPCSVLLHSSQCAPLRPEQAQRTSPIVFNSSSSSKKNPRY